MPIQVPPAADVLLLVLLAWTVGTVAFGALTRIGGQVQAGHFKVVWLSGAGMGIGAGFGYWPAWLAAAGCLVTFATIYSGHDRVVGLVTAAAAVAVLVGGALNAETGDWVLVGYTAATACLLGTVTNAMLLGHWHLNQPKLGTGPIRTMVGALWGSLAVFVAASGMLLGTSLRAESGVAVLGSATATAFAGFTVILTAMVTHLVRTRSIMSATGILYLEILMLFAAAFTGVLAALTPPVA